jgi:hypothetical protein
LFIADQGSICSKIAIVAQVLNPASGLAIHAKSGSEPSHAQPQPEVQMYFLLRNNGPKRSAVAETCQGFLSTQARASMNAQAMASSAVKKDLGGPSKVWI